MAGHKKIKSKGKPGRKNSESEEKKSMRKKKAREKNKLLTK
jgi:hypothetical protein